MTQNGHIKTATVRIQRYNPDVDKKPYLDTFTVDVTPETTILDALETIKSFQDGSVTFRRSCRHAICGSCAMNINGKNILVCNQPLREHLDRKNRVTIRPLPYLPVLKDLVVDRSAFWTQYMRVKPWLVPPDDVPEKEFRVSPEEVAAINNAEKCIMCGACYSACTITATSKTYIGPAALLKAFLRILDPRDSIPAERLAEVGTAQGVYRCHTIFNCIDACPKGLDPTRAIEVMRRLAMKRLAFEEEREKRQETINDPIPLSVIN